ncbi:MAG TPA: hypothetical protein VGE26_11120 [Sphingobacteriaceae bacterium]
MQSMSDKELDRFFQSRFEDFEVEPSASLWTSIEVKLDTKPGKKKQSFQVFWMAAASVVAVLGAGLWILNPEEKVYLQGTDQLAVTKPQSLPVTEEPSTKQILTDATPKAVAVIAASQKRESVVATKKTDVIRSQISEQVYETVETLPAEPLSEAVLAAATNQNNEVSRNAIVADSEADHKHTEKGVVHSTVLAMLPDESAEEAETLQQRRKIRSVGDIVNFVVAKVDQRDDKFIEMREDDEGTKISGINLGLFKLKSKKK